MSPQILELLFFAIIAFFVITKLISVLGSTTEDDPAKRRKSFFGEGAGIRDVTGTAPSGNVIEVNFKEVTPVDSSLDDIIVQENKEPIFKGFLEAKNLFPSFNPANFLKGAKAAFQMVIEAKGSEKELEELVDKRYMEHFISIHSSYGSKVNNNNLEAKIAEIYTFGNNIFVKILFLGKDVLETISNFHEEWTFTKNVLNNGPEWHLTNIDRAQ